MDDILRVLKLFQFWVSTSKKSKANVCLLKIALDTAI